MSDRWGFAVSQTGVQHFNKMSWGSLSVAAVAKKPTDPNHTKGMLSKGTYRLECGPKCNLEVSRWMTLVKYLHLTSLLRNNNNRRNQKVYYMPRGALAAAVILPGDPLLKVHFCGAQLCQQKKPSRETIVLRWWTGSG